MTQQFSVDPVTGNVTMISPEGIQTTYSSSGQVVSSKTPSQVQLEQQITTSGGTITPQATEQIQTGLQQQTKVALAGQQPQPFEVTTPEATFQATSGITPSALAGATGSVIPEGYMMTAAGAIEPAPQTFIHKGQEFTITPIEKSVRYTPEFQEYIWQTPYGRTSATVRQTQKGVESLLTAQDIGRQVVLERQKKAYIAEQARAPLQKAYYSITHPWEGFTAVIGGGILHITGQKDIIDSLRAVSEREYQWTRTMIEQPEMKPWLAAQDIFTLGSMVIGAKFIPALTSLTGATTWSLGKSVATGIGIGGGLGITAIGTGEAYKGYISKDPIQLGGGVLAAMGGAALTKTAWGGFQSAFLADFPQYRSPPKPTFYLEGIKQQMNVYEDARSAKAVSEVKGRAEYPGPSGFKRKVEFKFSPESVVKFNKRGGMAFYSETGGVQVKESLTGLSWLKARLTGEQTWQWKSVPVNEFQRGIGVATTKGLDFKVDWGSQRYDATTKKWLNDMFGTTKGMITEKFKGKPSVTYWMDIGGTSESPEQFTKFRLFKPKGMGFGRTDISYTYIDTSGVAPTMTSGVTTTDKTISDLGGGVTGQQKKTMFDFTLAPIKGTIKSVLDTVTKTFPTFKPTETKTVGALVFPTTKVKTKQYQAPINIPKLDIGQITKEKQKEILSQPSVQLTGLVDFGKEKQERQWINQITVTTPSTAVTTKTDEKLITQLITQQIITPSITPIVPTPEITPSFPKITIPPFIPHFKISGFVPRRMPKPFKRRKRKYSYMPSVGSAILGYTAPRIPKGFGGFFTGGEMRPLIVPKSKRKLYKKSRQMFTIPKNPFAKKRKKKSKKRR